MLLLHFLAFVAAAAVLAGSSVLLVGAITKIALKLKVSEFLVGFILVAVGTNIPDFLVSVVAATRGEPLLSLGTVIGANIVYLTLIIGIPALIAHGIRLRSQVRNREIVYTNLFAIAPLILLLDGTLSRNDGILLLLLFAFNLYNLILRSSSYTRVIRDQDENISLLKELLLFGGELVALLASTEIVIHTGVALATALGIPTILIGIFAFALGVALPDLSFGISAATRRCGEMLIADILGSVVTNSTLVLGTVTLFRPITIGRSDVLSTSVAVLLISLFAFTLFARSQYRISIKEGLFLVLGYLLFAVSTLLFEV